MKPTTKQQVIKLAAESCCNKLCTWISPYIDRSSNPQLTRTTDTVEGIFLLSQLSGSIVRLPLHWFYFSAQELVVSLLEFGDTGAKNMATAKVELDSSMTQEEILFEIESASKDLEKCDEIYLNCIEIDFPVAVGLTKLLRSRSALMPC